MENNNLLNYAFIDENNVVINLCVFSEHDEELLELLKNNMNASIYISCEQYGMAAIGGKWTGEFFIYENGDRVPLTNMPNNPQFIYEYDWDKKEWVIVTENKLYSL